MPGPEGTPARWSVRHIDLRYNPGRYAQNHLDDDRDQRDGNLGSLRTSRALAFVIPAALTAKCPAPLLASPSTFSWIVKGAERFYTGLGFSPLPASFWTLSDLYPVPAGDPRKKNTHASCWHLDLENDIRSLQSIEPNDFWFKAAHHELGHGYYFVSYTRPEVPPLLRLGANPAFHEGMGELISLACGMVPIADGSDLGGSLRNPASFCNVAGFRPSPGRVPSWPAFNAWYKVISTLAPAFLGPQMENTIPDLLEVCGFRLEHDRRVQQTGYPSRVVVARK